MTQLIFPKYMALTELRFRNKLKNENTNIYSHFTVYFDVKTNFFQKTINTFKIIKFYQNKIISKK